MRRVRNVAALTLGLGLVLAGPSAGLATAGPEIITKRSGTVVEIDAPPGTIVLEEVGPWRVKGGRTVVTDRRIAVTPATRLVLAERRVDLPSGFPGDFVESTLEPWAWVFAPETL
jgi:hypothetical protein